MLQGIELIDCAKANAKQGIKVAAALSGYENNEDLFIDNLQSACQEIGVNVSELEDLITDQQLAKENRRVIEVSPDTVADL
ncbi:hypothetical protein C7B62_19470 [Pleurocapsa sp. CCALA 161]|uniref:hypothetical protein n=1 Tax=Pleurocapsa sp. CCALA 161 TaxID=2107688 RepID=UPI000D080D22|nr:hypothetical protein [Pleurocapsa sp. CCALA 161]PSB07572.1 hypothetical protein C7B62_19470 [Pleurocapsa sp. CCALA 161]